MAGEVSRAGVVCTIGTLIVFRYGPQPSRPAELPAKLRHSNRSPSSTRFVGLGDLPSASALRGEVVGRPDIPEPQDMLPTRNTQHATREPRPEPRCHRGCQVCHGPRRLQAWR